MEQKAGNTWPLWIVSFLFMFAVSIIIQGWTQTSPLTDGPLTSKMLKYSIWHYWLHCQICSKLSHFPASWQTTLASLFLLFFFRGTVYIGQAFFHIQPSKSQISKFKTHTQLASYKKNNIQQPNNFTYFYCPVLVTVLLAPGLCFWVQKVFCLISKVCLCILTLVTAQQYPPSL